MTPGAIVTGVARVPVTLYGTVMGLGSLGAAWREGARFWPVPATIGFALLGFASIIWVALGCVMIVRLTRAPESVKAEYAHPVAGCFYPLAPATFFLLVPLALEVSRALAVALLGVALAAGAALSVLRVPRLVRARRDDAAITPAWHFAVVATPLLGALGSALLGFLGLAQGLLAVGSVAWLGVDVRVIRRLIRGERLPPSLRPLLAVELAPPAVACIVWLILCNGRPDRLAYSLFGYGLLFVAILLVMAPGFAATPFGPSWWALTFPSAAIANVAIRFALATSHPICNALALALFVLANIVVGLVTVRTLVTIRAGKFLPAG